MPYDEFIKGHYSKNTYIYLNQTEKADKKSKEFLDKIKNKYKYSEFNEIVNLNNQIKETLHNFLIEKNIISYKDFDERIVLNSSYDDIDENLVKDFLSKTEIPHNLGNINENIKNTLINRLKVLENIDNELKITNTGVLFFAKEPEKFIHQHEIRMVRFIGTEPIDIIDKRFVKSNICELFRESEKFFYRNVRIRSEFPSFRREDKAEYPFIAIREAITNAIAHRDYNIKGGVITFYIFSNRIEITSPGTLVPPLTLNNLGNMPQHRNINICRLLEKTKYMEEVGSGIHRMRKEMKEYNLDEPIFSEENGFFRVVFNGPQEETNDLFNTEIVNSKKDNTALNNRQNEILGFLDNNDDSITVKQYSDKYNISKSTARRDLKKLINLKLLKKTKYKGQAEVFYMINK